MPTCSEWFARQQRNEPAPAIIIGEIAQAHDGSLGMAHAYIDAVATAGATAVKFQTHIAAAESTPAESWRVKFSRQDASRYAYWQRMEFTGEQWAGLKAHAEERGLLFLSSPFSLEAVDLLARLDVQAWKVASGELSNAPMLEQMLATGKPMILSTGMSDVAEIDRAVAAVRERGAPLAVLQCTSSYPTAAEDVGLNMLPLLRERYACPVGLSDHSGVVFPALTAVALGAAIVEVHVTLSREMFGPDVVASVTTSELRVIVDGVRFIERMLAHDVDKDAMAARMTPVRSLFTKSVTAGRSLTAGTILERHHLVVKKPGTGIPAARLGEVVGGRLRRDVAANDILVDDDVERL